jgi:Na+/glutamate symporter
MQLERVTLHQYFLTLIVLVLVSFLLMIYTLMWLFIRILGEVVAGGEAGLGFRETGLGLVPDSGCELVLKYG